MNVIHYLQKTLSLGVFKESFVDKVRLASLEGFKDGRYLSCGPEAISPTEIFFGASGPLALASPFLRFFHKTNKLINFASNLQEGGSGLPTASLLLDLKSYFKGYSYFPDFEADSKAHDSKCLEVFCSFQVEHFTVAVSLNCITNTNFFDNIQQNQDDFV